MDTTQPDDIDIDIDDDFEDFEYDPILTTLATATSRAALDRIVYQHRGSEEWTEQHQTLYASRFHGDLAAAPYGDDKLDTILAALHSTPTAITRPTSIQEKMPRTDWRALWDEPEGEEWLHYPLLAAGRLVALYSPPKVGKSLLVLELAAGIATGKAVLGDKARPPCRVLYVDFENDPRGDVKERLINLGYRPEDLDDLFHISYPSIAGMDSEAGGQALLDAALDYECPVVIVDTFSRSVDGEENSNDTALRWYRHTGLLLKRHGVAVIRLDHSGKDPSKGMRGGSAKVGDVDAVWKLSRITEGQDKHFKLECEDRRFNIPAQDAVLLIERRNDPKLRHVVDAYGAAGIGRVRRELTDSEKRTKVIEALDVAGAPLDVGKRDAREILKEAGVSCGDDALREHLRVRVEMAREAAGEVTLPTTDTPPE